MMVCVIYQHVRQIAYLPAWVAAEPLPQQALPAHPEGWPWPGRTAAHIQALRARSFGTLRPDRAAPPA